MRTYLGVLIAVAACGGTPSAGTADGNSSPDAAPLPIGPYDHRVDAADVSILYPIDGHTDPAQLISADASGAFGALLPATAIPSLNGGLNVGGDLHLVALRLDPCSAHGTCAAEVRAVFQPIATDSGGTTVVDGAVHVFYTMSQDELVMMLEQLLTLKHSVSPQVTYLDALGPQPILVSTGLTGDFANGLRALALEHLGAQRITRITTMAHANLDGDIWQFALFNGTAGAVTATSIINVGMPLQGVDGSRADVDLLGGISGSPSTTPTVPAIDILASAGRPTQLTTAVSDSFAAAIDVEHPLHHNSEDTDCVTCHAAEGAHRAGTDLFALVDSGAYASARSLAYRRDQRAVTDFHAFGYLGTAVSVMQRTANESALAADRLAALLPAAQ